MKFQLIFFFILFIVNIMFIVIIYTCEIQDLNVKPLFFDAIINN